MIDNGIQMKEEGKQRKEKMYSRDESVVPEWAAISP
jgi:hypothetical protein